jgi:post-segregation antitoxin (ccd killing protein)
VLHLDHVSTRNITLTLPSELVRQARVIAASRDTSLSALVAEYLRQLTRQEGDYERAWQEERRLMADGLPMRVGEVTWSRADSHAR